MPVIGMESEFNVWLDEVEINPETYWKHPSAFIDRPLLTREKTSLQLPTGGAVYFDRGVIEVVTPVIELAPQSTARMVRNLWEQIGFVRDQLTNWGKKTGHTVRLKAYSSHYNITYEIPKSQQTRTRNEKALALLLAYILPVPVMLVASNRRSTGVGVRPRGGRIEVTVDFTPDPGLMIAAATLIVGIVREVISWPSYDLSMLEKLPIPVIAGVVPGKHTTRKGWLTKDFHYEQSPYTADVNAPLWTTQFGDMKSLRQIAKETAWFFRKSIRRYSDPFSFRLLFAILDGRAPSLLELIDRPSAYEDVGRLCRWGMVIHELKNYESEMRLLAPWREWNGESIDEYVIERQHAREKHQTEMANVSAEVPRARTRSLRAACAKTDEAKLSNDLQPRAVQASPKRKALLSRRRSDRPGKLVPRRPSQYLDRRGTSLLASNNNGNGQGAAERRASPDRRHHDYTIAFPDRRLTRSAYEKVFLKLVSGSRLRVGNDFYKPIGMKGWYHAVFRRESDGAEKLLSIDQLLKKMQDWTS
ncbi:MAG: hypothetical protein JO197_10750 [Acidobacteria bacterium]|nr:hypothetical protein [Acidobacteriota bacterium]MBV9474446.1 hypothetical protein [Acidobacteriota bacterium]